MMNENLSPEQKNDQTMNKQTYTALTIGPIYRTLQMTRSTKAVWAASYMFSYLMRKIIDIGIELGNINRDNILLPQFKNDALNDNYNLGVGLFPDRLIYKGQINDFQKIIEQVIEEFAEKVFEEDIKKAQCSITEENLTNFFKKYFHIHVLEIDLDAKDNVILKIYEYLDTAELANKVNPLAEEEKCLIEFLEKYQPNYNFLHRLEFGNRQFKSTAEIATAEFSDKKFYDEASKLIKRDKENDQEEYYNEIKKGAGERFRNYQKYMAIIQADGDNFGSFIKQLYTQPNSEDLIKKFSNNLWHFGEEAVQLINKFQGTPIYAGGDDLLFFIPVAHTRLNNKKDDDTETTEESRSINQKPKVKIDKTFFDLINEIDALFHKWFTNHEDFKEIIKGMSIKPTMSYGVSISYYKFPLNEARELGVDQLFYTAKKTCRKNAVSYAVLKHSGQYYGTTFHKDKDSYKTFDKMIKEHGVDGDFIHSIAQKLEPQSTVIFEIGKTCNKKDRDKMFDQFFENNFDESIHTIKKQDGDKKLIPFLDVTKKLFMDVYTENPVFDAGDDDNALERHKANLKKLYAALRFLEFINNQQER